MTTKGCGNNLSAEILGKVSSKNCTVGIVGLGYVGLPLALLFSERGFPVIGIDIDDKKIENLNDGNSYIGHISADAVKKALVKKSCFTANFSMVSQCDAVIICVPTPLTKNREPDLSFLLSTISALVPFLRPGQVLSLESTTYPGTTDEHLYTTLHKNGFDVGTDFFLVYSPEREDPTNKNYSSRDIPKIIGGATSSCLEVGAALYSAAFSKVVAVSSTATAEMTKVLENIYRAVNIGLVNEMKIVAEKMSIDIFEVIDAAATKPFGFAPFYPGPGIGGHCIPVDPFYLTWKAREFGVHTRFVELAGEVNRGMPNYVISKLTDGLNELGLPIKDSSVLVLGVAYKPNVDDVRESPSMKLIKLLSEKGAIVNYSDPFVPHLPKMRDYYFNMQSVSVDERCLRSFDAVILATDHDVFDYSLIEQHSKLLIDTRGRYRESRKNIIRA